jgi:predicted amino acid racemase
MAMINLPAGSLEKLVDENLSVAEWPDTVLLINEFRGVKKRGWLTKEDLIKVCYWKSPRAIHHISANKPAFIKEITATALKRRNEASKMAELIQLKGVSIPMASSLLTLVNPKRYGVMDIRVWELLFHGNMVHTNAKASNFKMDEWILFLNIIRNLASGLKVKARDIERTLFLVHKKHQAGLLYQPSNKKTGV